MDYDVAVPFDCPCSVCRAKSAEKDPPAVRLIPRLWRRDPDCAGAILNFYPQEPSATPA